LTTLRTSNNDLFTIGLRKSSGSGNWLTISPDAIFSLLYPAF